MASKPQPAKKSKPVAASAKVSKDGLSIPDNWTFKNQNVADSFDAHVREQLPWYDLATSVTKHIGLHYLPRGGRMYDLGASTGNITKTLGDVIKEREVDAISIDNSSQMASVWAGIGRLELADVANYNFKPFDFACCFLTLMFLSQEDQQAVLGRLRANMRPGGAIFVLDKVAPYSGYLGIAMHRLALAQKVASGVPSQAIVDKELSLSGVQRPIDPKLLGLENEVFRFGEFAGWVLV